MNRPESISHILVFENFENTVHLYLKPHVDQF
jgi:hypothetical protein